MIKCPSCSRDNADNFNFCLDCGCDLKAFREAFPDGVPAAPPPPKPARTQPAHAQPEAPSPSLVSPLPPPRVDPFPPLPPQPLPQPLVQPLPQPAVSPSLGPPAGGAVGSPLVSPLVSPLAPPLAAPAGVAVAERAWLPPSVAPQARPPAGTAAVSLAAVMPDPASTPGMPDPASAPGMPPTAWASATGPNGVSGLPTGTVVPCGSCGSPNAVGMKFCGNCGKRLDASVAPAPVVDAGPARTMFMHVAGGVAAPREKLCKLVTIDQSGREGMTFTLKSGETICGREQGVILLVDDPYVSPTHCKFAFHDGVLKVTDLSSLNGVYLRVRQERSLVSGDVVRVGRQLFRYETLAMAAFQLKKADGDSSRIWGSPVGGAFGRLVQILEDGRTGEVRLLSGERCQIGRETGDIVLPTDGFVSGRHCVFTNQSGTVVLADLGSSNGTYVRIRGEAEVAHGDFLLVGNQMLRVEIV